MKKIVSSLLCLMTALFLGIAQAAQIDGLQNNGGPGLPSELGVYVNPGHLGDALIGGYYNARNAITQISIVNTSDTQGVAVKVRFREGKFSNEVLDFYVCLSAGDRWTAWVTGDNDPTNPAVVFPVDDDTPTYPAFGALGEPMKYGTSMAPCVTADMTKEGYFTVIGAQSWADVPGNRVIDTCDKCGEQLIGTAEVDASNFDQMTGDALDGPVDALAGTVNIWDYVNGASDYSYNMLALSNFLDNPLEDLSLAVDSSPLFDDSDTNGAYDGIDAVNFVLMRANMIAFYDIRSWLGGAESDIIITFPTKRETLGAGSQNPFQPSPADSVCNWDDRANYPDFCEPVQFTLWDDEENKCGCEESGFSPREYQCDDSLDLCHEVNYIVIGEGAESILNSILTQNLWCDDPDYPFDIGWINFAFDWTGGITPCPDNRVITLDATPSVSSYGLPALGYELGSIVEGWWGHMLELRYSTNVEGVN
ncbi:MAG: hypothetical protein AVO38_04190 [delta proteobacterium ML8_D]|nr:MAG: hypothetical protein AVO38_04190 [delta proteobacterium ML8_D]